MEPKPCDPLGEIARLEKTMRRSASALGEAWMRSDTRRACSPFQAEDLPDCQQVVRAFTRRLARDRRKLERCLAAIGWQGPGLPADPRRWPAWWLRVYGATAGELGYPTGG